jgi:hypothetical protein
MTDATETIRYVPRLRAPGSTTWEVFDTQESKGVTDTEVLNAEQASVIAQFYNDGKCPACPATPMRARRARCPICQEWVSYTPDHPGHKLPHAETRWNGAMGRFIPTGRVVWRKPAFKQTGLAFLGHMNANESNHKGQAFRNTFYEPAQQERAT